MKQLVITFGPIISQILIIVVSDILSAIAIARLGKDWQSKTSSEFSGRMTRVRAVFTRDVWRIFLVNSIFILCAISCSFWVFNIYCAQEKKVVYSATVRKSPSNPVTLSGLKVFVEGGNDEAYTDSLGEFYLPVVAKTQRAFFCPQCACLSDTLVLTIRDTMAKNESRRLLKKKVIIRPVINSENSDQIIFIDEN